MPHAITYLPVAIPSYRQCATMRRQRLNRLSHAERYELIWSLHDAMGAVLVRLSQCEFGSLISFVRSSYYYGTMRECIQCI
jgi:hypothetical protein